MSRYLSVGGRPTFLLGANYWSRAGGPRMWEKDRFDPARVRAELAQMRAIGLNACRAFAFLPTFAPRPPRVRRDALARFSAFLDWAAAERIAVLPSHLVGHMSGENYDFPGQRGRSPYSDPRVLAWQRALVRALCRAGRGRVAAWILSNEMPLWGGRAPAADVRRWAEALVGEVRRADPGAPVGVGDGFMDAKGGDNGFAPRALAGVVDFLGPHSYHADADPYRQALYAELLVRMLDHLGLPVLFEEFGGSAAQVAEDNHARYLREVAYGCLAIGAAGALVWCFSDFDLSGEPPYSHHAFELGFGLTRADGGEKPACRELRALAGLLATLDLARWRPEPPRAAIVLPSYYHVDYPFSWEDRARMRRVLLQAFVMCARAGFEVQVVPEDAELSGYRLLLAPATQKLLAPTWERLRAAAAAGARVYASYFAGDYPFHQGLWCQDFAGLFGVRHDLRYGCYDLPPAAVRLRGPDLDLTFAADLGPPHARSYLPVTPLAGAEVAARDQDGRPALIRHRVGAGAVTFLNHPLEHLLGEQADVNETDATWRLYRALAADAGVLPDDLASDPRVTVHRARHGDEDLWFVQNRAWRAVAARVGDVFDGELAAKETRVVRRRR